MKIKAFQTKKEIDLSKLIDSRALICANSGAGKSYTARKIMEESFEKGVMSIVLDIEGEFKTLREKYDFLLIGSDGDVSLSLKSADLLPKKLLELNVSTIIDISDLELRDRIKYVKDFLKALMEVPRELWKPCLVFLDEAHQLCGQQEKQDSTFAVIDLMTRGRKRGFCGILLTQRISKLHKDAVAECNNYFVGRTSLDIDMKRSADILGLSTKQDVLSLRDLEDGEFYVFGPAITKVIEKEKIAETKTTHPKGGMELSSKIIAPTDKMKSMLQKISDLPREADQELKEMSDYKRKITELNQKIRILEHSKPQPVADQKALERARQQGFKEAEDKYYTGFKKLEALHNQAVDKQNKIMAILGVPTAKSNFEIPKQDFRAQAIITRHIERDPVKSHFSPKPILREKQSISADTGEFNLNLCERKIYSLLYQYSERSFTKAQIGVFTGYSYTSGGFNNAVSRLRSLELVEGSGENLKIKTLIPELPGNFDFSKEAIISKLGKCEKEIYEVLLDNPNSDFLKEELAEMTPTQYSSNSGGFNNSISRLNTLGIVVRNSGRIKLNPELLEI